jgi:hypothetical protein
MNATASFLAILFIGIFMSTCLGKTRGPMTKVDFIGQYNRTMQSSLDKNITRKDGCNRRSKNIHSVIIDPITVVPVLQDVLQQKPKKEKPTRHLRSGYYSQPILKTHLRGYPLVKNLAAYNPPNRYCYSIMTSIKSIVGI